MFDGVYADSVTSVAHAVQVDNVEALKNLIAQAKPTDTDVYDNGGWKPLHVAAAYHRVECLEILLQQDTCNVNWRVHGGETALMLACRNLPRPVNRGSKEKAVHLLLEQPHVHVNVSCDGLYTALHHAAASLDLTIIKWLVRLSANVRAKNMHGQTPLHCALEVRSASPNDVQEEAIAAYMIKHGAPLSAEDDNMVTPLETAIVAGNAKSACLILNHVDDNLLVNHVGRDSTPLVRAAFGGLTDVMYKLLASGADPNKTVAVQKGTFPLTVVCARQGQGHLLLIEALAKVTRQEKLLEAQSCPFAVCTQWETFGAIKVLNKYYSPDAFVKSMPYGNFLAKSWCAKETPLTFYLRKSPTLDIEVVKSFVEQGKSSVDSLDVDTMPPLSGLLARNFSNDSRTRKVVSQLAEYMVEKNGTLLPKKQQHYFIFSTQTALKIRLFQLGVLHPEELVSEEAAKLTARDELEDVQRQLVEERYAAAVKSLKAVILCLGSSLPAPTVKKVHDNVSKGMLGGPPRHYQDLLGCTTVSNLYVLARTAVRKQLLQANPSVGNLKKKAEDLQLPLEVHEFLFFSDLDSV